MIKRRFYKEEHGDKNAPSSDSSASSSSSSSDSELEAEADHDAVSEREKGEQSSGYESEDSSANEIDVDSSDDATANDRQVSTDPQLSGKHGTNILKESDNMADRELIAGVPEELIADVPDCMLKCKSVYKCRICPPIVCLNEGSMRAHLSSKRHARSEKLLKENRLTTMLNSDGEIENQETAAEMNARIVQPAKKNKGRQRQRKRMRKKEAKDLPEMNKGKQLTKNPSKRIRKTNI